jgi:two-component system LytT family response regulator
MEKCRSIIIEDEQDNRENLRLMLQNYCPAVEVIGEASNVTEGLKLIRETKPALVFLDVEMPDGTGFDLLRSLPGFEFNVIFVTAYSGYAIKAIKFNALDYVLKPIDISELCQAVDKVAYKQSADDSMLKLTNLLANMKVSELQSRRIALASAESLQMVEIRKIMRLQGENNYTRFFIHGSSPILVSKTIKEYATMLEDYNFFRVHQSHVVNLNFVSTFIKADGGYIVMQDGEEIGVARNRKAELLEILYSS